MDNYTTAETALKLKEKGFPHPEPKFGQMWKSAFTGYDSVVCNRTDTNGLKMLAPVHLIDWSHNFSAEPILGNAENIVLPTATDILKELGKDYNLSFFEGLFYCVHDNLMGEAYAHENPAEACAIAFMDK